MKDIYINMNTQDILRNLGISLDLKLDNSETYDYELARFDTDYDVIPTGFTSLVNTNLSGDSVNRTTITICEIDNTSNDSTYVYSGITQTFDYQEFVSHFNITGTTSHNFENFILNNDIFTYTGYTNETHYFKICGFNQ